MSPGPLRTLRVVIACAVLTLVAQTPAFAAFGPCMDAVACVESTTSRAVSGEEPRAALRRVRARVDRGALSPSSCGAAHGRRATTTPARARSIVPLRRIYLRHASLLR